MCSWSMGPKLQVSTFIDLSNYPNCDSENSEGRNNAKRREKCKSCVNISERRIRKQKNPPIRSQNTHWKELMRNKKFYKVIKMRCIWVERTEMHVSGASLPKRGTTDEAHTNKRITHINGSLSDCCFKVHAIFLLLALKLCEYSNLNWDTNLQEK